MTDYRPRTDVVARGVARMLSQYRSDGEKHLGGPVPILMRMTVEGLDLITVDPFRIEPSVVGYSESPPFTPLTQQVYHQMDLQGSTTRYISGIENDPDVGLPDPVIPPSYAGSPYTMLMRLQVSSASQFIIDLAHSTPRQKILVFQSERIDFQSSQSVQLALVNGETQWQIEGFLTDIPFNTSVWIAWSINGSNLLLKNVEGAASSTANLRPSQTRSWFGAPSSAIAPDFFPNTNDKRGFASVMSQVYYWDTAFDADTLDELMQWVLDGKPVVA